MFKRIVAFFRIPHDLGETVTEGVGNGFRAFTETWKDTDVEGNHPTLRTSSVMRVTFPTVTLSYPKLDATGLSGDAIVEQYDDDMQLLGITVGPMSVMLDTRLEAEDGNCVSVMVQHGAAEIITVSSNGQTSEVFLLEV